MKNLKNHTIYISLILLFSIVVFAGAVYLLIHGIQFSEAPYLFVGILLIVVSFYGIITCGQHLYMTNVMKKIAIKIENSRKATVDSLAEEFKKTPSYIDKCIMALVKGEYIQGFYYDHKVIEKIEDRTARLQKEEQIKEKAKQEASGKQGDVKIFDPDEVHSVRCKNCGATVSFKGQSGTCPYCSNAVVAKK